MRFSFILALFICQSLYKKVFGIIKKSSDFSLLFLPNQVMLYVLFVF